MKSFVPSSTYSIMFLISFYLTFWPLQENILKCYIFTLKNKLWTHESSCHLFAITWDRAILSLVHAYGLGFFDTFIGFCINEYQWVRTGSNFSREDKFFANGPQWGHLTKNSILTLKSIKTEDFTFQKRLNVHSYAPLKAREIALLSWSHIGCRLGSVVTKVL